MNDITYWIIMLLLAAGCAGMLFRSYAGIKKRRSENAAPRRRGRRGSGNPAAARGTAEGRETGHRKAQRQEEQQTARTARKKKRQWKIILEDIDSWQKYSFVFYDAVGIGRGKHGKMYEQYLPLDDNRISKAHCVILRRGDQLYLKDEGSRNGTFLNGKRVEDAELLQKDDIIGVGGIRLEVQRVLRESDS